MTKPRQQRWVALCGALRSSLEFNSTLAKVLDFRRQGLVDEIVLSTWYGEIERIPGLQAKLNSFGVHIAECEDVPSAGPANFWRQQRSFDVGLRFCPSDSMVLRARTDKCYVYFDLRRDFIERDGHLIDSPQNSELTLFQGRIFVPYLSTTALFFCKDIFFYGKHCALEKLIHYEQWSTCRGYEALWAEHRWFAFPFIQRWSVLRDVLETVQYNELSTALCDKLPFATSVPKVISKLLGFYWRLLSENIFPFCPNGDGWPVSAEGLCGFGDKIASSVATVPGGKFSVISAAWLLDSFSQFFDKSSSFSRDAYEAFSDDSLSSSWVNLSLQEKDELFAFVEPKEKPRYRPPRFQHATVRVETSEREVVRQLNSDSTVTDEILDAEYEITCQLLGKDRFSPILECKIASHWYLHANRERAKYWIDKVWLHQSLLDYEEFFEAFVRMVRFEWLQESQLKEVAAITLNNIDSGRALVEQIITPVLNSRIENIVLLNRRLTSPETTLPALLYQLLVVFLAFIAEEESQAIKKIQNSDPALVSS